MARPHEVPRPLNSRRTSETDPIRIAELHPPGTRGIIGVTFCPGKKDSWGNWDRDLDTDLDAIAAWGASLVVTLIAPSEFSMLGVSGLETGLERRGIDWLHMPIVDVSVPDRAFERRWKTESPRIRALLAGGKRVLVHCRGGIGRAGTIAACLLVEFGMDPDRAIDEVRRVRRGAIETPNQERYVRSHRFPE